MPVRLPSELISITRNQLLSMIDTKPRAFHSRKKTKALREKEEEQFRLQEEEYLAGARKQHEQLAAWLDDPATNAIVVLEVKAMDSSSLGSRRFLRVKTDSDTPLHEFKSTTAVGDVPSRFHYATYYCASPRFIKDYIHGGEERMPFPYGLFTIEPMGEDPVRYRATQRPETERPLTDTLGEFKLQKEPNSDLADLIHHLDQAVFSSDALLDLFKTRR